MVKSFLLLTVLILPHTAKSQSVQTSSTEAAQQNAIEAYSKNMGKGLRLYNGSEYSYYRPLKDEHPYLDKKWTIGTVDYDNQLFTDLSLLYNINSDQLIADYATGGSAQLIKPLINFFTLGNRKFVKLNDSLNRHRFYEILFDGKIKVYSKHQKEFSEIVEDGKIHRDFREKTFHFLLKDKTFIEVNSKKTLLHILANHAPELKRFIREKKLKFKSADFDKSIVEVVAFYEQI